MKYVILFFTTFVIIYLIYFLFVIKRKKSLEKLKNSLEVRYLVNRYKIDINNIDLKKMARRIALCNSLIISITFMIVIFVKNFILMMLLGFVVLFPLILIGYHILAKSFIKKKEK